PRPHFIPTHRQKPPLGSERDSADGLSAGIDRPHQPAAVCVVHRNGPTVDVGRGDQPRIGTEGNAHRADGVLSPVLGQLPAGAKVPEPDGVVGPSRNPLPARGAPNPAPPPAVPLRRRSQSLAAPQVEEAEPAPPPDPVSPPLAVRQTPHPADAPAR